MSAAMTRRFVARCAADDLLRETRRLDAERKAAAAAKRKALTCDMCGERLVTPAKWCGFCEDEMASVAA